MSGHDEVNALRDAAEARLPADVRAPMRADDPTRLVHELQVHQIELEMQNSELQRTRGELETALALYTELYDFAPVGYLTLGVDARIAKINLTGAKMLGVDRSGLRARRFDDFVAPRDRSRWAEHFARLQRLDGDERRASTELALQRADGSIFHVQINWIDAGGSVRAAHDTALHELHITLIDITGRKEVEARRAELEQALQVKNSELERARIAAEQANLAKSEFLSRMSHELRTPLGAILGFAQLIESGSPPPTPTQARSLGHILKGGWYLLDLINEILDLALIESGKLALSLEAVALCGLMRECENMVAEQAQKRNVRVSFPLFATPIHVHADRMRLKQVVINLLSNAIKYNKVDGAVSVECALVTPESVRISVSDTGSGLDDEQIAQLFQPFNRLGQEAGGAQGTGIGLVVCKRLIDLMGGAIGVLSEPGKGSVFWFELPLTIAQEPLADSASAAGVEARAEGEVRPCTVLYVEDNPANLMLVEALLERRPGIRFLSASDGQQGVELARATLPDVILMDINLPGISGTEAMRMLAADPRTQHIPVIAISANAMPGDIEKGRAAGFYRYITKPLKVAEFMTTLDLALGVSAGGSSACGRHE